MADKYLRRDAVTGVTTETEATDVSAGVLDAGEVVALNAAGEIDATMLPANIGVTQKSVIAAVALTANDLVYVDGAGDADLASAAVAGNATCGFAATTVIALDPVVVLFEGVVSGFVGLTPGARQYLDDTVPGGIVSVPVSGTGKLHQFIGKAISTTEILFEPDDAILLA